MSALRHGSLEGQRLDLLTPGKSVVVIIKGQPEGWGPLVVEEIDASVNEIRLDGWWSVADLTYIGERDADGWIHAPEGGWLSNPVPGMRVEAKSRQSRLGLIDSASVRWDRATSFRLTSSTPSDAPAQGGPLLTPTKGRGWVGWTTMGLSLPAWMRTSLRTLSPRPMKTGARTRG